MSRPQLDYDQIANGYDQRFHRNTSSGISRTLQSLIKTETQRVLEVGCGTGHWLALLSDQVDSLHGLDLSAGMLGQATRRNLPAGLIQGQAENLPFHAGVFDLLYCVNAIHHFSQPEQFVQEAARLLKPGGILAVIGSDPHHPGQDWYVYDYFEGTHQTDLERFPSLTRLRSWLKASGLKNIQQHKAQHIQDENHGQEVLFDPFLSKDATSQLALLSEDAYQSGIARIKADLEQASARGEELIFRADIQIFMTRGQLPNV